MTISDIKAACKAAGSHWFSRGTMAFFGTRCSRTVYRGPGGTFFVTSEQPPHGPRAFTVRRFVPGTAHIDTVGGLCAHADASSARRAARRLASGASAPDKGKA